MKYSFSPSPNYRNQQSTVGIMRHLTLCLCSIVVFAVLYYWKAFGPQYGLRVLLMTAASVAAALITEGLYFKLQKKDVVKELKHSFGWVTALILVLITKINVSFFALIVSTVIAIIAGKLVFGGFGQNIFNPAAFGEALIMNSFAASTNPDFVTSATPMGSMNAYGWVMDSSTFGTFIKQFGGLGNMFLGNYPSVIGGSCALLILLCWAYLLWQKDVDWRLSATYLACVFVFSLIIGLIHGAGIWYAVFHVLGGGVLFGAVFMMTDPVTNPITIPGRIIFAVGAAALTLIIRLKASLPDGVLFSILLMNMLTPGIDKFVDGNQIKDAKTIRTKVLAVAAVCTAVTLLVGATCEGKIPGGAAEAAVEGNTATGTADGFGGEVSVTLTVEDGKITECTIVGEKETPAVGGAAIPELTQQILDANSAEIDGVTGATITSTAVKSAAGAALEALGQ